LALPVQAQLGNNARERYLSAEQALGRGEQAAAERYLRQNQDYPLWPYLQRDLLLARLERVSSEEVRTFLAFYGDAPFVYRLRREWLRQLSKRAAWDDYLSDYQPGLGVEFDCRRLRALMESGQHQQAFADVPALWVYGRSRPDTCDPVFDAWIKAGRLQAPELWGRIAASFATGELRLVRYLRDFLSPRDQALVDVWIEAHRKPAATLAAGKPDSRQPKAAHIALHALQRWSRDDPAAVLDALPGLQRRYALQAETLDPIARSSALLLAARRDPEARLRLLALPETVKDEEVFEWLARSAMASGNWEQLSQAIDGMPIETRSSLRWQYWRARSLDAQGRRAEAETVYRALALNRDYYGFLSASRVGLPYRYGHQPLQVDPFRTEHLNADDAIQRAHELFSLDRDGDARREWNHALRNAGPDDYRAAAQIARDWGWHSMAIFTVAKAGDWDDLELRFPISHHDTVLTAAREESLEPQWVFAVLRQESAFQPDARSSAGAMGLMQVMPATARQVAKALPRPLAQLKDLYRPDVNIPIGTRYLRMSRSDLFNSAVLATAGYNAGPHRVIEWLPKDHDAAADVWVETVPYRETRGYLQRVMEYSVIYEHRLGLESNFLRDQMGSIPRRAAPS
jgi:soluble lytic murein transglycosylase